MEHDSKQENRFNTSSSLMMGDKYNYYTTFVNQVASHNNHYFPIYLKTMWKHILMGMTAYILQNQEAAITI